MALSVGHICSLDFNREFSTLLLAPSYWLYIILCSLVSSEAFITCRSIHWLWPTFHMVAKNSSELITLHQCSSFKTIKSVILLYSNTNSILSATVCGEKPNFSLESHKIETLLIYSSKRQRLSTHVWVMSPWIYWLQCHFSLELMPPWISHFSHRCLSSQIHLKLKYHCRPQDDGNIAVKSILSIPKTASW